MGAEFELWSNDDGKFIDFLNKMGVPYHFSQHNMIRIDGSYYEYVQSWCAEYHGINLQYKLIMNPEEDQ